MVVGWKKVQRLTFLFSFVPALSQPTLRLSGWTKETIFEHRKLVGGNRLWWKNVSNPEIASTTSKTKEVVDEENASFALILLIETCLG